ncbi:DUF1737 domain-containing protein [Chryseobacterium nepalense]|nr:hypothetical protein [Chryseobacterium nepalense]
MEYKIVKEITSYSLEQKVNVLLNEGWEPTGGILIYDDYYFQALVRKYE